MKFSLKGITPQRGLLYLLCLAMLPAMILGTQMMARYEQWGRLEEKVTELRQRVESHRSQMALNQTVLARHSSSDRFYVDRQLESLPLLSDRIDTLRQFISAHPYAVNDSMRQQLAQWSNGQNRLLFVDGQTRRIGNVQETPESLAHPVELDAKDLAGLLERIEGPYPEGVKPPQMLITDLTLEKKGQGDQNEVLRMDLKLLKRDY